MIEVHIPTVGKRILGIEKYLIHHPRVKYMISHQNYCEINRKDIYALLNRKDIEYFQCDTVGVASNRNNLLNNSSNNELILFSDDDVLYSDQIFDFIINWFNTNDSDFLTFSVGLKNSKNETMIPYPRRRKKLDIYNCGKFGTINLVVKAKAIQELRFDILYGPGSKFMIGEDFIFITDLLKRKFKGVFEPTILVYHEAVSTGIILSKALIKNRLFLFRRVYGSFKGNIIWLIFIIYKYNLRLLLLK